jgi:RNA polymerase sigma factor (sigma-70 family)
VEQVSRNGVTAGVPMTTEQLEVFYTAHYLPMVKFLVILDATVQEAENAVQEAMQDFWTRSRAGQAPEHSVAYVQRAAYRFFIKKRQRERERLPRELQGGHLVIEAHVDDRLTDWEDSQYVEHLLECLTPVQRRVIELVMAGLSTREIAGELGKTDENVRRQLKYARDRLKSHPEIAPPGSAQLPGMSAARQGVRSTVTAPEPGKEEVQ